MSKSRSKSVAKPTNKKLYSTVVEEAKKRFHVWPSAYASGWVVSEYKRRGGKYSNVKSSKLLDRWFKEKWINVCYWPKIVPCGRPSANDKNYPYCRPLSRVTSKTPKTVRELSKKEIRKRCKRKRKNPHSRILS